MAEVILMPRMSDTMEEGTIVKWNKKVGDKIKIGETIAEVATDKANMELESFNDGVLLHITTPENKACKVNDMLAIIGKQGEDISALLNKTPSTQSTPTPAPSTPAASPAQSENSIFNNKNINIIRMPLLSDTMKEGKIVRWNKKMGDFVKSDECLAEVETDKATMEIIPYVEGHLLYIGCEAMQAAPINAVIAVLGKKDVVLTDDDKAQLKAGETKVSNNAAPAPQAADNKNTVLNYLTSQQKPAPAPTASNTNLNANDRVKVSPLAKKIAQEKGIELNDLKQILGSGDNGRIIKRDIDNFKASALPTTSSASMLKSTEGGYIDTPISSMRKTIAKRLTESVNTAPHIYLTMSIDMDNMVKSRESLIKASGKKISFNDIIVKITAMALKKHPNVNSAWLGDKIRTYHYVNIGVAVAVEDGLLVPVIRNAEQKSITDISTEIKDLATKAKNKKLLPAEWEGNTFTISNLGMFGIDQFTAIINPPDAAILAVGGISQEPVVKDGQIVIGNVMKLTLSGDHRVIDGATAAAFLQTLKQMLENPLSVFL